MLNGINAYEFDRERGGINFGQGGPDVKEIQQFTNFANLPKLPWFGEIILPLYFVSKLKSLQQLGR